MIKYFPVTTEPKVGDLVVSKILKIKREVVQVTDGKVTVVSSLPEPSNLLEAVMNCVAIGFKREFKMEEFFENHLSFTTEAEMDKVKINPSDLKELKYALGDTFINHDTQERVFVGSVKSTEEGKVIVLGSLDKFFQGERILYEFKEQDFLDNFYIDPSTERLGYHSALVYSPA